MKVRINARLCVLGASILLMITSMNENNIAGFIVSIIFYIFALIDDFWKE